MSSALWVKVWLWEGCLRDSRAPSQSDDTLSPKAQATYGISDDLEKCNGLNKGRKDALIFCAEKFKATIPRIAVVRKPRQTKGGETVSQSTCESCLIDQAWLNFLKILTSENTIISKTNEKMLWYFAQKNSNPQSHILRLSKSLVKLGEEKPFLSQLVNQAWLIRLDANFFKAVLAFVRLLVFSIFI